MGLDSYIIKKYYIGANFEHRQITGSIDIYERGKKINIDLNEVRYIECQVAYFEYATMIHDWFVKNVQAGEDDCSQYYVEREQFKQLLETCEKVLENRELAETLLPMDEESYFEDCSFEYYYESAW